MSDTYFIDRSRPIIPGRGGKPATEESITITNPRINGGRPTNIPSIWGGRRPPGQMGSAEFEEWAVEQALRSGVKFPAFPDIDSAVAAARARSDEIGRVRREELDQMMNTPAPKSPWEFP